MIDRTAKALVFCGLVLLSALCAKVEAAPSAESAATNAARALLHRLLPGHEESFCFEQIPPEDGKDLFEIESRGDLIVIRGNSGLSMAMGVNWYLKQYCNCHVSWCGSQLELPDPLPRLTSKVRRVCWARYRYFLNYCCFGYSLAWWNWAQWERLIDWMALNGINAPLSVTGQEAVWQAVCQKLGLADEEIAAFLAGPPYLPFGWRGCLDGWGGPLPQAWIDRHAVLEKKIVARQRALGMTPVLQGFTGHVPAAIAHKHPDALLHRIHWIEWQTCLLDPLDPLFAKVARLFMEEQARHFGTDHLYAADTFIEMTPPSGETDYLANLSRAIYSGMSRSDPAAVWVLQGWTFFNQRRFWSQERIEAFLGAIPGDRMVVLDLFCETNPMWKKTDAFCGKPWVWCNVQNFGCNVHMTGALNRINEDLHAARRDPGAGRLEGLGFVNEGLGYNPVVYDLMFEMAWRDEPVDLEQWIEDFALYRYGADNDDARNAWRRLLATVYSGTHRFRSKIVGATHVGHGGGFPGYDPIALAEAWGCLVAAADALGGSDAFCFDLVNVARQVLSIHAARLHGALSAAYRARDQEVFEKASADFVQLIEEMDALLATREEFLLGRWLDDARRWGTSDAERNRFEWNARRVLTLWGEGPAIDDYAWKEWSGMLSGFYLKRWDRYLDALAAAMREDEPFDAETFNRALRQWMADWSDERSTFPAEPRGSSVAVAKKLWKKYRAEVAPAPDAVSLTTGKPVTCSFALQPYPASLANDGRRDNTDRYWATDVRQDADAWWQVDLEEPVEVGTIVVVGYYGDERSYGFVVETSLDRRTWETAVDQRGNEELSTIEGYTCTFETRAVRYIRVTMTTNSANTGRHLVEVMAF